MRVDAHGAGAPSPRVSPSGRWRPRLLLGRRPAAAILLEILARTLALEICAKNAPLLARLRHDDIGLVVSEKGHDEDASVFTFLVPSE